MVHPCAPRRTASVSRQREPIRLPVRRFRVRWPLANDDPNLFEPVNGHNDEPYSQGVIHGSVGSSPNHQTKSFLSRFRWLWTSSVGASRTTDPYQRDHATGVAHGGHADDPISLAGEGSNLQPPDPKSRRGREV